MYEPIFNTVLVQIDDKDAEWGAGNDESMLGKSYSKGKFIVYGPLTITQQYPNVNRLAEELLDPLKGRNIMWNEGTEAGTVFEFDDKLFGFIYWWDIRGVLVAVEDKK